MIKARLRNKDSYVLNKGKYVPQKFLITIENTGRVELNKLSKYSSGLDMKILQFIK